MPNVRAGQKRKRITIESKTRTDDGSGGATFVWAEHHRPWAEIHDVESDSASVGGAIVGDSVKRFEIRYVAGVTTSMEVVYSGSRYNIIGIRNVDERNRELWLICREKRDGSQ